MYSTLAAAGPAAGPRLVEYTDPRHSLSAIFVAEMNVHNKTSADIIGERDSKNPSLVFVEGGVAQAGDDAKGLRWMSARDGIDLLSKQYDGFMAFEWHRHFVVDAIKLIT